MLVYTEKHMHCYEMSTTNVVSPEESSLGVPKIPLLYASGCQRLLY